MTPNKTTSQPLTPGELLRLRRFSWLANEETDRARACYPYRLEDSEDPAVPLLTLFEELGKVVRANNKVGLAADEEVAESWLRERRERLITARSVLDRIWLTFGDPAGA